MWSISDEFLQYWVGAVSGAVVLLFLLMHKRKSEVRIDRPADRIFKPRPFTAEELREYDGSRNELIFVGVKGIIYNVAKEWYGPGCAYNAFAGHESSRQLGKTKVGREETNCDWTTLSQDHLQTLDEWEERFSAKYIPVGWYVPDASYFERAIGLEP